MRIRHIFAAVAASMVSFAPISPIEAAPQTPFSIQASVTGTGIAAVYRLNGPTQDGPYVGASIGGSNTTSDTNSSKINLGAWIGTRHKLHQGTYFVYGFEAFTKSGNRNSNTLSGTDCGPFIGVHQYLTDNCYITVFNNPIYISSESVANVTTTTTSFFTGGIGLGYQF